MTEREDLDERFRSRLKRLADAEPVGGLDEGARTRVIERARRQVERARRARWVGLGAAVIACAAAAALWFSIEPAEELAVAVATPPPPAARCAGWAPVAADALAGEGPWSLGARGAVIAQGEHRVRVGVNEPCHTEIILEAGTVVVRADDLGEGELEVVAGSQRVRVTGTLFSVERGDDALVVRVAEGHVEVRGGTGLVALDAGEALTIADDSRGTVQALDAAALAALRSAFEPSIPVGETETETESETESETEVARAGADEPALPIDPGALALQAEGLYRRGDLGAARDGFRRAGAASEAAALRWARLELDGGALDQVAAALALHTRRHRHGALGAEAAFLRLELAEARHDEDGVREAALAILERYPGTPQARAAERRLGAPR
jgi:hypothetical protein